MDLSLIVITILIIFLIVYLCYRSKQYYNTLESFDNTQSSLSTYFQNSVDFDSYTTNKNMYNAINVPKNSVSETNWNGIWINNESNIYAQFLQNNGDLIIGLSNSSVDDLASTINNFDPQESANLPNVKCYINSSIGKCILSNDLSSFILKDVYCNRYVNNNINFTSNNLSGTISIPTVQPGQIPSGSQNANKTITLTSKQSSGMTNTIILNFYQAFSYYDSYAKNVVSTINTYPTIPNSNFVLEETICAGGGDPCMDTTHGLGLTTYDNATYNACGTKDASNNCVGKPKCVFYNNSPDGLPQCTTSTRVYDYMNFLPLSVQSLTNNGNLYLCDYFKYFNSSNCNACIICYVTNLSNAYTLNYEFFGTQPGDNNLTVQSDVMDLKLNTVSTSLGLLNRYRNAIKNDTADVNKGISFTNCLENNNTLENCKTICKQYITNYKGPIGNATLSPCIWRINKNSGGTETNPLNSCPFTLSTHDNYNSPVKYVECNSDGTVNLSLFYGGTKQQLMFDKAQVINTHIKTGTTSYNAVAMTANIKTTQGLYLMPSMNDKGFFNSNIVRLLNKPADNGKWLIIGFTLNQLDDYKNITF